MHRPYVGGQYIELLLLYLTAACGCVREAQWVESIRNGDYKIVKLGKYPLARVEIKYDPNEFIKLRKELEKESELFNKIVMHFYPEERHNLNFEYKYGATHNGQTILRFFSRLPDPDLYAGYSIQFVIEEGVVKEIYLFKTPLE